MIGGFEGEPTGRSSVGLDLDILCFAPSKSCNKSIESIVEKMTTEIDWLNPDKNCGMVYARQLECLLARKGYKYQREISTSLLIDYQI